MSAESNQLICSGKNREKDLCAYFISIRYWKIYNTYENIFAPYYFAMGPFYYYYYYFEAKEHGTNFLL